MPSTTGTSAQATETTAGSPRCSATSARSTSRRYGRRSRQKEKLSLLCSTLTKAAPRLASCLRTSCLKLASATKSESTRDMLLNLQNDFSLLNSTVRVNNAKSALWVSFFRMKLHELHMLLLLQSAPSLQIGQSISPFRGK